MRKFTGNDKFYIFCTTASCANWHIDFTEEQRETEKTYQKRNGIYKTTSKQGIGYIIAVHISNYLPQFLIID